MAYSTARLERYLDTVDRFLDVDSSRIREASNGDQYLTFKVTTRNARQERLEDKILTSINNAVDPDAYGVDTGSTGGRHTSTYTVILDKSNHDIDLISGRYRGYYNDVAGISERDADHATRPGYPTPYLIDGVHFKVDAPHATVLGQSIGDWTADWWTWGFQSPAQLVVPPNGPPIIEGNPFTDATGDFAGLNNGGPVFFVAGTFGGTAERTFNVPEGKPLLIPLVNFIANRFDTDIPTDVKLQKAEINQELAGIKDTITGLFAEIDGIPVQNLGLHYEETDFFSLGRARPDTLATVFGAPVGDDLYPSKSIGNWLMVEHLSPGEHTLHFGGSIDGTTVSVTDHIYII